MQGRDEMRRQYGCNGWGDAETYDTHVAVGPLVHCCDGRAGLIQDKPGAFKHLGTGVGQRHPPRRARQQCGAHFSLQPPNQVTERGLADMQSHGGTAKVQLRRDGNKRVQLAQFHPSNLLACIQASKIGLETGEGLSSDHGAVLSLRKRTSVVCCAGRSRAGTPSLGAGNSGRGFAAMTEAKQRRTQRERVDESSRRLAAAAIELIVEKGYANTTAKDIGLRAGYSRAMVAERFGSKEALMDAVLNEYETRIDIGVAADASGFDRAIAPVEAVCQFVAEDPTFLRAMFIINFEAVHDTGTLRDRIRQWLMGLRETIADGIRAGMVDGSITVEVDADDFSREILTTGIGYCYWWVVLPDQIDFPSTLFRWRERITESLVPQR